VSTFSKCQTCGKMQLMGTGVECVWCEGERAAMKPSKDEQIATLTRDLAAAREQLDKCKAAGFPLTADNVIWSDGPVYRPDCPDEGRISWYLIDGRYVPLAQFKMDEKTWQHHRIPDCYSTRTAAEAAREGKE